ncbi:MAG: AAA family ATPase, partial [Bacteroidales bacterium]|nr:AAA family ATPase [Bacteroidales bacterium]
MAYLRSCFNDVLDRLNEDRNKIQVLIGPRQVGKTTLIEQVLEKIRYPFDSYSADDVSGANTDWLSQIWEAKRLKMDANKEKKRLLVGYEIQKISNWSETVKAEWDK